MNRNRFLILLLFFLTIIFSGCTDNERVQSDTIGEAYYYDTDMALECLKDGYINHDIILTPNGVLEYASYESTESIGYDYSVSFIDTEGQKTSLKWTGIEKIVKGIGYITNSDDFVTVEGNYKTSDKPEKWLLCTYDKHGSVKKDIDVTDAFKDCSLSALCNLLSIKQVIFMLISQTFLRDNPNTEYSLEPEISYSH